MKNPMLSPGKSPTASENAGQAASPAGQHPMTRVKPFGWLLLVTGVIGWLASGALTLEKLAAFKDPNHVTSCDINPWVSCGKVMQTWQSSVFGFPNMFIGLVAFAVLITTGMAILSGARLARWYWLGLQAGVTLGFAFVVWLWSQALYSINVLCPLCMVVWAMMIPLFVWTTLRNITHRVIRLPRAPTRHAGHYGWIITVALYLAVTATIVFAFSHVFLGGNEL